MKKLKKKIFFFVHLSNIPQWFIPGSQAHQALLCVEIPRGPSESVKDVYNVT